MHRLRVLLKHMLLFGLLCAALCRMVLGLVGLVAMIPDGWGPLLNSDAVLRPSLGVALCAGALIGIGYVVAGGNTGCDGDASQ